MKILIADLIFGGGAGTALKLLGTAVSYNSKCISPGSRKDTLLWVIGNLDNVTSVTNA
ncbi:MAG: hypothetical protein K9L75_06700 [Spirochaetia bacterium]|nr:hypothetical protein [Spirochaetia bacterium]